MKIQETPIIVVEIVTVNLLPKRSPIKPKNIEPKKRNEYIMQNENASKNPEYSVDGKNIELIVADIQIYKKRSKYKRNAVRTIRIYNGFYTKTQTTY